MKKTIQINSELYDRFRDLVFRLRKAGAKARMKLITEKLIEKEIKRLEKRLEEI